MPFRKRAVPAPVPASPEALYPVLSHGADAPRELWSRQADVLRAYDKLKDKDGQFPADIAIELPTVAGKTLVGCLIAEWRRRSYQELVAYVAPTRRLAQQAAAQAPLYGIPAVDLTGTYKNWDPADEVSFRQGDAVAFATYSAVFNSNPHVNARTLVLDDAHAAEGYVAGNWSVRVQRSDRAYPVILDVLASAGRYPVTSSVGCGWTTSIPMTAAIPRSRRRCTWPGSPKPRRRPATWSRCSTTRPPPTASPAHRSSPWR